MLFRNFYPETPSEYSNATRSECIAVQKLQKNTSKLCLRIPPATETAEAIQLPCTFRIPLSLSFTTPCTGTCTFAQNRALHTHTDIYTHTALSRGRTKFLKSGFRTMILAFKSELSRPRLAAPLVRIYTTMRGRSLARTQKTPRIPGERKRSSRWSRARERETSERTYKKRKLAREREREAT